MRSEALTCVASHCILSPLPLVAPLKVSLENALRDAITYTGARTASTSAHPAVTDSPPLPCGRARRATVTAMNSCYTLKRQGCVLRPAAPAPCSRTDPTHTALILQAHAVRLRRG